MQITVDTTKDSPEEIRRAIKILSMIVGDEAFPEPQMMQGSAASPEVGTALGGMFGDSPKVPAPSEAENQAGTPSIYEGAAQKNADEPIADHELFADLFTEDEIKKMEPPSVSQSSENAGHSPEKKLKSSGIIPFY